MMTEVFILGERVIGSTSNWISERSSNHDIDTHARIHNNRRVHFSSRKLNKTKVFVFVQHSNPFVAF